MNKIQAVIFDLFGVILTDALRQITQELAATNPAGVLEIKRLINLSNRGLLDRETSSRNVAAILGISVDEYRRKLAVTEARDSLLILYIKSLRPAYKTALLSNISPGGVSRRFTEQEIGECFDTVVASGEVGVVKPDARIYQIAAERLGVPPDACVFTDDIEPYCDAARAVGMQAIVYKDFESFKAQLEALLGA